VHTVPDPFYIMSGFEITPDTLALAEKFVHLPALAIVPHLLAERHPRARP